MIGVRQAERLSMLLQQFEGRDRFPDILERTGRTDEISRRIRPFAEADCKRLEAALHDLQIAESEYQRGKAGSVSGSSRDNLSDRCTRARNALETIVREFGRVQVLNHADLGWIPTTLETVTIVLVGDRYTGQTASQVVSTIAAQGIFTLGVYGSESDVGGSFADQVLLAGAVAAMSEETLASMLESILARRQTGSPSVLMEWLPHSLPLLLRERC
jgi:hypothetical protein